MGKTRDLFKKTGDTKGTFHAKMGTIKDRNGKDPTETETELCLSVSCGDMGQQWTATGAGALGAVDVGMA